MSGALRVVSLYPELLGTYGDGGNVIVLMRRLAWRAIPAELVTVSLGDPVPAEADLYVLGGGEDEAQSLALPALRSDGGLHTAIDRGAHVFAVCAGLQLLGGTMRLPGGTESEGLGILDVSTTPRRARAVGEVVATPDPSLGLGPLTGFENHGGGSRLGPAARPFATVQSGTGNGAEDGQAPSHHEGVLQGNILATYLHGPVLARNPGLADLLLTRALGGPVAPLERPEIDLLRQERLTRRSPRRRRRLPFGA